MNTMRRFRCLPLLLQFGFILELGMTCFAFTTILLIQQVLRHQADFLPHQLNERLINEMVGGVSPANVIAARASSLEINQSPFSMILDGNGKILASSALLQGHFAELPAGVIEYTRTHFLDRVTWEPATQVREAIEVQYIQSPKKFFVVSGQSLMQTEVLVDDVFALAAVCWLGSTVLIFTSTLFFHFWFRSQYGASFCGRTPSGNQE